MKKILVLIVVLFCIVSLVSVLKAVGPDMTTGMDMDSTVGGGPGCASPVTVGTGINYITVGANDDYVCVD
jgi:hypothetical protein